MAKRSKKYRAMLAKVPANMPVDLDEGIKILKQFTRDKFDQSVETALKLGIDPKQPDQTVRGAISLPAGVGKVVRLAVFAKNENADKARAAGADIVGDADLAARIKDNFLDFDLCLATPDMMGIVGPLGKTLGPRGLMPTPKNGTVTADIATAVKEFKAGKIEYRSDQTANLHALVGKLSFTADQLRDNIRTLVNAVRNAKPAGAKGTYIQSITICATMTPGIRVVV